jgi:hypothetical protein
LVKGANESCAKWQVCMKTFKLGTMGISHVESVKRKSLLTERKENTFVNKSAASSSQPLGINQAVTNIKNSGLCDIRNDNNERNRKYILSSICVRRKRYFECFWEHQTEQIGLKLGGGLSLKFDDPDLLRTLHTSGLGCAQTGRADGGRATPSCVASHWLTGYQHLGCRWPCSPYHQPLKGRIFYLHGVYNTLFPIFISFTPFHFPVIAYFKL